MKTILRTIVQMQKDVNDLTLPGWLEAPPPYLRAAMMETVEAIDHLNSWKWWKHNKPDYFNAGMEMVDVLHFVISDELVKAEGDVEKVSAFLSERFGMTIEEGECEQMTPQELTDVLEEMVGDFLSRQTDYRRFFTATLGCKLSKDMLCKWYVGKNVLNRFRQEHGYKDGTYHKNWFGKEDNDYLIEILEQVDLEAAAEPAEDIYIQLKAKYQQALVSLSP